MKRGLPVLAMLVVGCSGPSEAEPSSTTPKPEPAPVTTPQAKTRPKVANPDRIHQLADLAQTRLKVKGGTIVAWLMDDDSKRQEGMMFLTDREVRADQGMLFLFPSEQPAGRGFWMRNTILPLDIVYLDRSGRAVHIANGKPFDETSLPSPEPFQFVLELKKGQAARVGIRIGTQISIPADVRERANE